MTKLVTDIKTLTINVMPKEIFEEENAAGRLDPAQPYFVTGMAVDADTLNGATAGQLKPHFAVTAAVWSFEPDTNSLICKIDVSAVQADRSCVLVSFCSRNNLKTDLALALNCLCGVSSSTLAPAVVEAGGQAVAVSALVDCTLIDNMLSKITVAVKLPDGILAASVSQIPVLVQPLAVLL